jgi:transcriptional regulator with XRE-family HTH domain
MRIYDKIYYIAKQFDKKLKLIANNLKTLRRIKDWPQRKAAYNLELKLSRYQAYEEGRAEPNIEILIRIAVLYNISVDRLLKEEIKIGIGLWDPK